MWELFDYVQIHTSRIEVEIDHGRAYAKTETFSTTRDCKLEIILSFNKDFGFWKFYCPIVFPVDKDSAEYIQDAIADWKEVWIDLAFEKNGRKHKVQCPAHLESHTGNIESFGFEIISINDRDIVFDYKVLK